MIEKLIDDHGEDVKVGYDIFCAFVKTLQSSCLGEKVVKFNLTGVVPAFHGWAHSRDCQLEWHPLYMDGVGIEDFEESERVFSRSNDLAPTTRLSTRYHRRIQIEEHFDFHDEDKHARSGKSAIHILYNLLPYLLSIDQAFFYSITTSKRLIPLKLASLTWNAG